MATPASKAPLRIVGEHEHAPSNATPGHEADACKPAEVTRAHTRCVRVRAGKLCSEPFHRHVDGLCPNGSGDVFRKHITNIGSASQSFNPDEVGVLDTMLKGVLVRGTDLSALARSPAFHSLARKVSTMRMRVRAQKAGNK